jgi:shikimate 5-dehydrogenase
LRVTNRRPGRIEEMREIHERIGFAIETEYTVTPEPTDNDAVVAAASSGSVVVNATGLGKDRPGSPLTDDARFPTASIAWDFNYRGDLVFLDQARAQAEAATLSVVDGWLYFVHGWSRVVNEVFHLDLPTSGPEFDRLSELAGATQPSKEISA